MRGTETMKQYELKPRLLNEDSLKCGYSFSATGVTIYFWIVVYSFFKDLTDGGGFWKNRSGREIKV